MNLHVYSKNKCAHSKIVTVNLGNVKLISYFWSACGSISGSDSKLNYDLNIGIP